MLMQVDFQGESSSGACLGFRQRRVTWGRGILVYIYLVGAPVPCGHDRQPESHPGPGQISRDWVSEEVHCIGSGQVAGSVGNNLGWHGF